MWLMMSAVMSMEIRKVICRHISGRIPMLSKMSRHSDGYRTSIHIMKNTCQNLCCIYRTRRKCENKKAGRYKILLCTFLLCLDAV